MLHLKAVGPYPPLPLPWDQMFVPQMFAIRRAHRRNRIAIRGQIFAMLLSGLFEPRNLFVIEYKVSVIEYSWMACSQHLKNQVTNGGTSTPNGWVLPFGRMPVM